MSTESKPTSVPPLSEDYISEAVRRARKQVTKPGGGDASRFARALLQVYERDRQWARIVETETARADAAERKLQDFPEPEERGHPARARRPVKDPVSGRSASDKPPAPPASHLQKVLRG